MATAKQERARRARRWCLRALTVVGGSIAASVAAWAMTTATASADHATEQDSDSWFGGSRVVKVSRVVEDGKQAVRDGVDRVDSGVGRVHDALRTNDQPGPAKDGSGEDDAQNDEHADGTHGHSGGSGAQSGAAHESSPANLAVESLGLTESTQASADGIAAMLDGLFAMGGQYPGRGDVTLDGALNDAAHLDGLRGKIAHWLTPAADDVLPGLPGGIDEGAAPMPMPVPTAPSGVGGSVSGNSFVADAAMERGADLISSATGDSDDRGMDSAATSDVTDSPSDGSPVGLPAGAPAAPSAPGSGGTTGGHADGSPFAVTHGSGIALDAIQAAKAVSGAAVAPIEPGRQPGVTPD